MATDPGTHPGGAFLPGSIPGVGGLPGGVVFSENLPSTTLSPNEFETPLWEPSSVVTTLFPDPSAGFVEGLGGTPASTGSTVAGSVAGNLGGTVAGTALTLGQGQQVNVGLQQSAVTDIQTWLKGAVTQPIEQWFGSMQNWVERAFIMVLALALVAVASMRLSQRYG